jgi:hypothetical protein
VGKLAADGGGIFCRKDRSTEYVVTAAFLLSVVAGSFAAVILGGYGIAPMDRVGSLSLAANPI